jgi:hypothetical protein
MQRKRQDEKHYDSCCEKLTFVTQIPAKGVISIDYNRFFVNKTSYQWLLIRI